MELEGVATFASPTATSYRYVLTVKDERLSIWMEDPASKKQWFKGNVDQASFLTPSNTVAGASIVNYAMVGHPLQKLRKDRNVVTFHEALSLPLDESNHIQRNLTPQDDGSLLLELSMSFSVLSLVGHFVYAFSLAPGSLERVHALEEKLREKQDEVEQLKAQLLEKQEELGRLRQEYQSGMESRRQSFQEMRDENDRVKQALAERNVLKLDATQMDGFSRICWTKLESSGVAVDEGSGTIRIRQANVYQLYGVLAFSQDDALQTIGLVENGRKIKYHLVAISAGGQLKTVLIALLPLQEGDEVAVKCTTSTLPLKSLFIWGVGGRA